MTNIELADMLKASALEFLRESDPVLRNVHMHQIRFEPANDIKRAVLVTFINHVLARQGMDYGLYAADLNLDASDPLLGLATTRQLLDELKARAEVNGTLDYRTAKP